MNKIKLISLAAAALLTVSSCGDDDLSQQSIFGNEETSQSAFDKWIKANYTDPYNIRFVYRYTDYETDNSYNVIPASEKKSEALAILIKYVWVDAYDEVMGNTFLKQYAPRIFQLIGSNEYNSQGSVVMGTAEGGVKITLFDVNSIDPSKILIDQDSPLPNYSSNPVDLNYRYFHTIHHEFCHILTQKKNYSTDFRTVSAGNYHTSDWINVKDEDAPSMGFVTNYASSEYNEDFAEIYATYVTHSDKGWKALLDEAVIAKTDENGDTVWMKDNNGNFVYTKDENGKEVRVPSYDYSGYNAIMQKLDLVKDYFKSQWGFDIDKMREVVLRRSREAADLKLTIE